METFFVPGIPVGAVRMTRSDVWKKRPAVVKYREWCDTIRRAVTGDPTRKIQQVPGLCLDFVLPVPASTSAKKTAALMGAFHDVRPDIDNLSKAVMDALFEKDSGVAYLITKKVYGPIEDCGVSITLLPHPSISSTLELEPSGGAYPNMARG